MTRSERRSYWRQHIEAWRATDESQAGYCRRCGLSAITFSQWKRRLGRESVEISVSEASAPALVAVKVTDPAPTAQATGVTVELAGEVRLHLTRDFDAAALQRAVTVLTDAWR